VTVAQELHHSQPHGLSIPAGPLEDGLNELAQQSGLQILFSSSLVERLTGPEVKGSLTAEEALGRLLANTALRFEFVNPHTITIVRAGAEAGPSADESDPGAKSQPESNKPSNDLGNNLDPNGENKMTHRTFWARLTGFLHEDNISHRLTASALFASLLAAGPVVAQESSTDELETVTVSA
jgi:hypothetical protein